LAWTVLVLVLALEFTLALSGISSSLSSISAFGAFKGDEAATAAASLAKGIFSDTTSPLDGGGIARVTTCFAGTARGTSSSEESESTGLLSCGLGLNVGFLGEDGEAGLDLIVFGRLA
jgi:hypothetical protein